MLTKETFFNREKLHQVWTIANDRKLPLDIKHYRDTGRLKLASYQNELCLTTYEDVLRLVPNYNNLTYFTNATKNNIIIVDIEKTCPEELRNELLKLPYFYAELSHSKQGLHLFLEIPESYDKKEELLKRTVIKHPSKTYEVLIKHYTIVTFNEYEPKVKQAYNPDKITAFLDEMLTYGSSSLSSIKPQREKRLVGDDETVDTFRLYQPSVCERQIEQLVQAIEFDKTPKDYAENVSDFEFAFIGHIVFKYDWLYRTNRLIGLAKIYNDIEHESTKQAMYVIYKVCERVIPYRQKHDTKRYDLPWLMFNIYSYFLKYKID